MDQVLERKKPHVQKKTNAPEEQPDFFARGVGFDKLFWVFFIASFLGAILETAFMLLTRGELQNRSGVLYGPFSLVWGFGAVLFTLCFRRLTGRGGWEVFLGGAYEYLCSWLQEVLFGACFWDYSHLPLNIHGRVSLIFTLFWGLAALAWVRAVYPALCRWIGRLPNRRGPILTRALAAWMAVNIALSGAALGRMNQRQSGLPPANVLETFLDQHFPDQVLYHNYSNLVYIGTPKRPGG